MFGRLKGFGTSMRERSQRLRHNVGAAVAGVIGLDEVVLGAGLVLVTIALWPDLGQRALLVPGLAAVWISLPTRGGFITRPPQDSKKG